MKERNAKCDEMREKSGHRLHRGDGLKEEGGEEMTKEKDSWGLQNEDTDGQRGTMSSAVACAGVRQVHLMTHLLV